MMKLKVRHSLSSHIQQKEYLTGLYLEGLHKSERYNNDLMLESGTSITL